MRRLGVIAAWVVTALCAAGSAGAAQLIDRNATGLRLSVNAKGEALLTYRSAGRLKHVLVWGAINAHTPQSGTQQVKFKLDYAGGWGRYRSLYWQHFGGSCGAYDGPSLPNVVAACKAPDGSYWAVQQWQPNLPHRGFPPYKAGQTDWELDLSHWTGALAQLEVHADWAFNGHAHNLFGRLMYAGTPVHGFHTVKGTGAPQDRYGRSLYIDTLDSAYGPGWKRETSIVFRNPTGVFCYSFWPTTDVSLPGHPQRPAGNGSAYRIEVLGPGVTPNLDVQVQDPGAWNPNDAAKVSFERDMKARQLELAQGDAFCSSQT